MLTSVACRTSASFRGNNPVREAMHSVFLYHAIANQLSMAIVNAGQLAIYADIDDELRELVEDVVLNRNPMQPIGWWTGRPLRGGRSKSRRPLLSGDQAG